MHAWLVEFHKEFLLEGGREAQEGRDLSIQIADSLDSPLDRKEIKLVNPKGNQP